MLTHLSLPPVAATSRVRTLRLISRSFAWAAIVVIVLAATPATGQVNFDRGQNIAAVYEGWELNDDGSFNLVFGYMNRNWEEVIDVPIGPENSVEPGGPDQGQPTHFLPRRNRFIFRIRVPADFGDRELVWTLTTKGKTEKAYATLKPDYFMDNLVIQANVGAGGAGGTMPDLEPNTPPQMQVEGDSIRKAQAGQPMTLAAVVTDDGLPQTRPLRAAAPGVLSRITTDSATGLRASWFVYRGAGDAHFDPPQIKSWEDTRMKQNSPWSPGFSTPKPPAEGRWETTVTFSDPGTYVLRCQAHDGGLSTEQDVTVVVGE